MKTELRKIGNSQGVIIPKPFLIEAGLKNEVEMKIEGNVILIFCPKQKAREGWIKASKAIAEAGDDTLVWPEFPNENDENLRW
ncbi:MAG: AbrB/MazE/SpoVT family DNA-binding domain-containing protein [Gammaproteobacteria bacterium]|nr:AbrB/MazE/SpoVT family DNA-binding domain-containing protein [Gammaproteobacteria bacterium]